MEALKWALSGPALPLESRRLVLGRRGEGHLEVLKWARAQDPCPWSVETSLFAAENGRLEVFEVVTF